MLINRSESISIKIASVKMSSICIATYSSVFNSNHVYQMLISNDSNGSRSSRSRDSAGCGECSRRRWRHSNYHNKPRVWRFPGDSWIVWDDYSIFKHELLDLFIECICCMFYYYDVLIFLGKYFSSFSRVYSNSFSYVRWRRKMPFIFNTKVCKKHSKKYVRSADLVCSSVS